MISEYMIGRVKKWLGVKPYTKAMYMSAFGTILMAVMSMVMCYTVVENRKIVELTTESLTLQKQEFEVRNRPYVDIKDDVEIGGVGIREDGSTVSELIVIPLENMSEVPAVNVRATCRLLADGEQIGPSTVIACNFVGKGVIYKSGMFLTEEQRSFVKSGGKIVKITVVVNYSGILGGVYQTAGEVMYNPALGTGGRFVVKQEKTFK